MKKLILYCLCLIGLVTGFYFLLRSGTKVGSDRYQVGEEMKISRSPDLPVPALCGYQTEFAVPSGEEDVNADGFSKSCPVFIMVDNETKNVVAAKNVYRRIYPASTTKIMTAILVLDAVEEGKFGLNDVITLQHDTVVEDPDAVASDLNEGCSITVRNLLHGLLIRSYNDYAIILAERIGGSVEGFAKRMNEKARAIGATNTHFTNPHGLTDDDHKTTPYDLYLIFNEALKYDMFKTIISQVAYTTVYNDANGAVKEASFESTNLFFKGTYQLPQNISCMGGKTGTTSAAGSCLIIYATDSATGKEYISVIMDAPDREASYNDTETLYSLGNSL